ncbi:MAG: M28 family peptidase [Bacteroidetes bacterium]|nr:M28 family peptidase [Bacteroidota bacterium]
MKNKFLILLLFLAACGGGDDKPVVNNNSPDQPARKIINPERPGFSSDSAYAYTAAQVAFGPRIPGTEAHKKCSEYFIAKLKSFGAEVIEQRTRVTVHTGEVFNIVNIMARVKPELENRIMLSAHWDTRPNADQDQNNPDAKFDGAVDGAASAGILMEVVRQLAGMDAPIGVDIVLFDAEDYGHPRISESYCLGSQYFAANPPVDGYKPKYGILLDMVAAPDATFYREGYSSQYASQVLNRVWSIAAELGYSNHFVNRPGGPITDDHYFINTIMGVPTIDIIHNDERTKTGFGYYWHTTDDNMLAVNKYTMQAVGEVLIAVIYSENYPN